ncbi:AAA family ATPase [Otariodibacter sp.]|uniref:AAA family ATPase n=1 Tax=Otariodibacter sp. TaxID=3030919 RepID=UPI0026130F46|nr:AAA family ATPase [Otariodibacter sp.]
MSKIQSLSISGYKSIKSLEMFKLTNLNVLIGANGAGKSNFISLFKLLNEMYEKRFQLYVQKQGGPDALLHFGRQYTDKIHAEFYFAHNGYKIDLEPTNDNRLIFGNEVSWFAGVYFNSSPSQNLGSGHEESLLPEAKDKYSPYVRDAIKKWRVYHFHDTSETAKVKQRHSASDNLILKPDAANLGAYLRMLHDKHHDYYQRIVDTIQLVLPFFGGFIYREGEPENIELEWFQKQHSDTPLKAHVLSDGSLRFICLMTLLLQPSSLLPETVLIDEPELGLHPYAISVLADVIHQVSDEKQLIISTQSVELVNLFEPEDVIVVNQEDDASTFTRLDAEKLSDWLEEYALGELWKQNIFGGRP